jgi:hypothetical protein
MHLSGTSSSSPRQRLCELVEEHSPHKPVAREVHRRSARELSASISRFIAKHNPNNPQDPSATS